MINESYYWKNELYKSYLTLAKFRFLKNKTVQSNVKLEKGILFGAYIIRKLDEAKKIPPHFLQEKIVVNKFNKNKDRIIDHMNSHRIERNYDLSKSIEIEKDYEYVVNQFIHSFNLIYTIDDNNLFNGFLLNSDRSKESSLYHISLKNILYLFLKISEGDMTDAEWSRESSDLNAETINNGKLKLVSAVYTYNLPEDLNSIISKTMNGQIYLRDKRYKI